MTTYLHEIGVFCVSHRDKGMHLLDELLLLVIVKVHVPFREASFSRTILDEDEANLQENTRLNAASS